MNRKKLLYRAVGVALSLGIAAFPLPSPLGGQTFYSIAAAAVAVGKEDVVLVGSLQTKLGSAKDWDPADGATTMQSIGGGKYQLIGKLPAGNYEFKIAVGGSWQQNYGAAGAINGANIELRLKAVHEVTFTYDAATHQVSYAYDGMQAEQAAVAKELAQRRFVVAGNMQQRLGGAKDWDVASDKTQMEPLGHGFYSYMADLPAGAYFYKIAVNGSWTENYGLNGNFDGANVQLTLDKPTKVTIYYNDATHKIKDSTTYKMLADAELPRISGDIESAAEGELIMRDTLLDQFYTTTLQVKAGTYTVEVQQKDQPPVKKQVQVTKSGPVNFYFDGKARRLIVDDGSLHEDKIYHDTWDKAYRVPFEAIKVGTEVKLSLRAQQGDLKNAQLVLYKGKITAGDGDEYNVDYEAGTKTVYDMQIAESSEGSDLWSVTIQPTENGIYGYKILLNGIKEYGDDAKPGHTGMVVLRGAKPFQLTVYRADYKTPEWAKEAVVYQIFPDRFFNGDPSNDQARTLARGSQPVQHRAWTDLPANASKTPEADGDRYDCNDFFGGDLAGITKKLDYLQNLGITAIYLNPIMNAASNHRYDTVDYGTLDPFLGNMDDFHMLVNEMKKRGMRLIMDGVFDHVGDDSIYFNRYGKYKWVGAYEFWSKVYDQMNQKHLSEAVAKEAVTKQLMAEGKVFSPYHWENWFEIKNQQAVDDMGKKYAYHDWQGYSSLVKFKAFAPSAGSPDPENKDIFNNIDLDNYFIYGKDAVLTKWFGEGLSGWRFDVAKEISPNFWQAVRKELKNLKTQTGDEPLLLGEIWQDGSQFLTGDQFDSVMNYKLSFAVGDLYLNRGDAKAADEELKTLQQNYPKEALYDLMNIVDSHDTVRAIYKFGGGQENVAQASRKDFNYSQGKQRLKLAVAFLMGYPGMPTIYYGDEAGLYGSSDPDCRRTYPWGKEDQDLIDYYREVIGIRNSHKQLFAHGDLMTLYAEGDIYAYARTCDREAAVVALNRGTEKQITLPVASFAEGTVFKDALDPAYETSVQQGQLIVNLGENQSRIMLAE